MVVNIRATVLRNHLEETYCTHRQGLFSLALSITGCRQRAEDAIQTAFERLSHRDIMPAGNIVSYVFACVRNAALDAQRAEQRASAGRESLFNGRMPASDNETPDANLLTKERDQILRCAVDALPDADREVVVLKIFAGLTFDAIGEIMEQPVKTVATRYRRALVKLEEALRGRL